MPFPYPVLLSDQVHCLYTLETQINLLESLFGHELCYLKVIETWRKLWLWIQENINELQLFLNAEGPRKYILIE